MSSEINAAENTKEIIYRTYRDGDEKAIIDLFNYVFKRNFNIDYWHWAYRENPVKRMDVVLAFCGKRLVGQSASTPLTYNHNGSQVKATRTQNVMVHPDYQGRGIFTRTLKELTEYLYSQNIDLVVTFPNNNSLPTFIRKLDYTHVADIHTYQVTADTLPAQPRTGISITIDESVQFTDADHACIQECLRNYSFYNYRDLQYLAWRFGKRSGKDYRILRAIKNGKLVALVIFKYYPDASGVDLVEFFTTATADDITEILIMIRRYYQDLEKTVNSFGIWLMPHYTTYPLFTVCGFIKTGFSTHMVTKSFSPATADGYDRSTSYYLAMGDSDVY